MKYHVSFDIDFKRNVFPGRFIVLEGIDASGKTTQSEKLADKLKHSGKQVVYTKEPTDGPIGKLIRRVLKGEITIPAVSFQYLFAADRAVHQEYILDHLKKGDIVISDRYFWSALSYGLTDCGVQFSSKDKNGELLTTALSLLSMYHQFIVPNYTFYLQIPVATSLSRLSRMDKEKELYEKKEKLIHIAAGYEWLINKFPNEFTVIDGTKPADSITKEIIKFISLSS